METFYGYMQLNNCSYTAFQHFSTYCQVVPLYTKSPLLFDFSVHSGKWSACFYDKA